MKKNIRKILIANRSEIACRIIQASQELGIATVAVYSEADRGARHTQLADEAIEIGPARAADSYLNIEKIIAAAKTSGADAIHPGYGFLSERAQAAEAIIKAGLIWIGPQPASIRLLGDKLGAKKILDKYQMPSLPWAEVTDLAALKKAAIAMGFPVLLKAASGGGGKGMRLVKSAADLEAAAESAASEAKSSFGDATLLVEKYLSEPRHIEVQIFGDGHGNLTHFGERECSVQRRHQKVIEEAPAIHLKDKTRESIWAAALRLAKGAGYQSAGTMEFLVDQEENFYFLEMNSRLQVEHSVTEAVWGIDLVQAQIRVAQGETLAEIFPERDNLQARGHAIEARIYAEDAGKQFAPSPGMLSMVEWPTGTGIRIDTGVKSGSTIGMDYDAMIAKLTVHGVDRQRAMARLRWSLERSVLFGLTTNINYLLAILDQKKYVQGKMHVKYLETEMANWQDTIPAELMAEHRQLLAESISAASPTNQNNGLAPSPWEKK